MLKPLTYLCIIILAQSLCISAEIIYRNDAPTAQQYSSNTPEYHARLLLTLKNKPAKKIENAVEKVKFYFIYDMDIWQLEHRIVQAMVLSTDDEILFEMATPLEALEVLAAYEALAREVERSDLQFDIIIADTDFPDHYPAVNIDVRMDE